MIIKLKGADFSANNIGKVQVTTELDPFTIAAIEASGNTSLTLEQKSALNALFLAMGVDGSNDVMSKMHKVYLPIIAGDVSKALINYNTESFMTDKVLSDTYWTLRNHGLVGLQQGQAITLTESNPIKGDNFSCFLLKSEVSSVGDDPQRGLVLRGKTNTDLFLGIRYDITSGGSVSLGNYGANWGSYGLVNDKVKTTAINSAANYGTRIYAGTLDPYEAPYSITADMSGESSQTLYVFGLANENLSRPISVALLGEALTKEQTLDIASKIDALYDTFA